MHKPETIGAWLYFCAALKFLSFELLRTCFLTFESDVIKND